MCVDPEIFSKGEEGLVQDLRLVTCFTKRRGAPTPGYPSPRSVHIYIHVGIDNGRKELTRKRPILT